MIPTGTLSYMEELVISKKSLSEYTQSCAMLYCTSSVAFKPVLGCTKPLPEGSHQLAYCLRLLLLAAPAGYQQLQHLPVPDFIQKCSKMLHKHLFCLTAEIMNTVIFIQGTPIVNRVHSSQGQGLDLRELK